MFMSINNFHNDFFNQDQGKDRKIIPFEKRRNKVACKSKSNAEARIIIFPKKSSMKIDHVQKWFSLLGAVFGSCGGLVGAIVIILILALLIAL